MVQPERIDSKYASMQPETHDILAAFALYSPRLPHNEQELAKGLLAAVESAPPVGLGRFVDVETRQLTDAARISLQRLQQEGKLAIEGDSFTIPPNMADKLKSTTRTYYKNPGLEALQQAAEAAGAIWLPK